MDFTILGPFEVRREGELLRLPAGRERSLLGLLLLHRGEAVSTDRILDALWGEQPPETAGKAVQGYVSHLRRILGDEELLVTRTPGYALLVEDDCVDATRFARLAADARRALDEGASREAARLLDDALALWRGPALADFAFESFAQTEIQRLEELRLAAAEDRMEARLQLGHHADLVGELASLVGAQPLRERLRGQLMLALYRNGRQAEALEAYRDVSRLLDEELGLAPGPALQQLERAILNHEPALDAPARPTSAGGRRPRGRRLALVVGALAILALVTAIAALTRGRDAPRPPAVAANSLVRIDAETNRIVEVVAVGRGPVYPAADGDFVWVINWDDRTLSRVQARSLDVDTVGGLAMPMGLAFDGRSVWVGSASTNHATRLDVDSLQVDERLELPVTTAPAIAVGARSLWVSSGPLARGGGSVARVRLADGRVEKVVTASNPVGVTFGNDAAWFTDVGAGTLNRIDARTNRVRRIELGGIPLDPALGFGSVWIPNIAGNVVWRVNEQTITIKRIIEVGREPWAVAVGAGAVWVANRGEGSVSRIDPATNVVVATIKTGFRPHWLAVAGDGVWVAVAGRRIAGD